MEPWEAQHYADIIAEVIQWGIAAILAFICVWACLEDLMKRRK